MNNIDKNINSITFICLPPAQVNMPSPAFSYLKSYLSMEDIKSNIIYANFIFKEKCSLLPVNSDETDDFNKNLPFVGLINQIYNLGKDDYILEKFQTTYPDIFLYDKSFSKDIIRDVYDEYDQIITEIAQNVIDSGVNVVGLTSKFYQWLPSIVLAHKIKQMKPSIIIITGGWSNSQSALDFMLLHNDLFDYAIWGEGEIPLAQLIKYINGQSIDLNSIRRLIYKNGNTILKSTSGTIDSYFNYEERVYVPDFADYLEYVGIDNPNILYPLERGRGCNWNKCAFCYLSQGYRFRLKPNKNLLNEISSLVSKYGITSFFFTDNDVTGSDLNLFEDLVDGLIRIKETNQDFEIKMAEIISKNLTDELIRKMRDAGFASLQLGIEAISENLLQDINKKQTVLDNFYAIKTCLKYGIDILGANLIYNTPNETSKMVLKTIENLYYFRFILNSKTFSFNIIPLGVSNFSKYLADIRRNGQKEMWNISDYQNIVDDRYHNEIDSFSLFDYISSKKGNELWDDFIRLQEFYKAKEYSYAIVHCDDDKFIYREFIKDKLIKELNFDESLYKNILTILDRRKYSLNELYNELIKENSYRKIDIEKALENLYSEGLVWIDNINEEVVSIINFTDQC